MTIAGIIEIGVLGACLATAAVWDLVRRRIPNGVNVATALLGLGAAASSGSVPAVLQACAGAGLLFVLLFLAWRQRWIGGGDVKLGAAFGAWLGPIGGAYAVVVGAAVGGVVALYLLLRGGSAFRTEVKANLVMAGYTGQVGETKHRPDSARTSRSAPRSRHRRWRSTWFGAASVCSRPAPMRGSIAVELGLAMPVFILIVCGGLNLGRALVTKHNLESAVAYVTRASAIANQTSQPVIHEAIRARLRGEAAACTGLTTRVTVIAGGGGTPSALEVSTTCELAPVFDGLLGFGVKRVSAVVAMPLSTM